MFWKIYFLNAFGAHKLVHSEPFLDYRYELWHLLSALCSDVRKFFLYRCTSTFSALNYCCGIFLNPSPIYTKWFTQTFPQIFWIFAIFDRHFSEFLVPPTNENENYVVHLQEQPLQKKRWKPRRNRPIIGNAMLVRNMHPWNARRSGLGARQKKTKNNNKKTNTTFSKLQPARIVRSSPNFAWW